MNYADQLAVAQAQLRDMQETFEYAYAYGHGCTIEGGHPRLQAIRDEYEERARRVRDLRALAQEHVL